MTQNYKSITQLKQMHTFINKDMSDKLIVLVNEYHQ